jgi:hypothetical protein
MTDIESVSAPPNRSLPQAVEHAVGLLRMIRDDYGEVRQTSRVKSLRILLKTAIDDLNRALQAHSDEALRDLREVVLTALGPNLIYSEVVCARRVIRMILECLEDPKPAASEADDA